MSLTLAESIETLEAEADRLDAEIAGNRIRAAAIRNGVAALRERLRSTPPAAPPASPGDKYADYADYARLWNPATAAPAVAEEQQPDPSPAPVPNGAAAPDDVVAVPDQIPDGWRTGGARERILAVLADLGPTRTVPLTHLIDCPSARVAMALRVARDAGEIERVAHGVHAITDEGRARLAQIPPPPVSAAVLAAYEEQPHLREAPLRRRVLRAVVALGSVTRDQLATVLDRDTRTISAATASCRESGYVEVRQNGTTKTYHPTPDGIDADQQPLPRPGGRSAPRTARRTERTPSTTATPTRPPVEDNATDRVRALMADGRARSTDDIARTLDLPISTIRSTLNRAGLIRGTGRHAGLWRAPRTGQGLDLAALGPITRNPVADIDRARARAAEGVTPDL